MTTALRVILGVSLFIAGAAVFFALLPPPSWIH